MATLILSTVGTALGGPVGGALGSLLGQAIDQQIFAPDARQGPRLGDLNVQTSTYGSPIPQVFGTMRVAGSVIWADTIRESGEAQGGAKGQPEVMIYSYSASFAVALSSRDASRIGRIWADGKLLRGAQGDFKVKTGFRFYPGREDQAIDQLIGSVEGIEATPAYRGLALAVFEDLELAEYGNRIPFITFELVADEAAPSLGQVLTGASGGAIVSANGASVSGYAAHGPSIQAALQPLIDSFDVQLVDDGGALRSVETAAPVHLDEQELGCAAGTNGTARAEKAQAPSRALPSRLTLTYYEQARDYQTSQAQASASAAGTNDQIELPAVVSASAAKGLVESALARRWAQREKLTLRLPPLRAGLSPGSRLRMPGSNGQWSIERVTLESFVTVVEARRSWAAVSQLPAEPGRGAGAVDVVAGPTRLVLMELPDLETGTPGVPVLHLAAASSKGGWRSVPIEIAIAGAISGGRTATAEAVIGAAVTQLAQGGSALLDLKNIVEVELAHEDQWLVSCDDAALANGANLALIGGELVQFGSAVAAGPKRFRLQRLLRGRRGTEWAASSHSVGEPFVLLSQSAIRAISLPPGTAGTEVRVTAYGIGDGEGTSASRISEGESLRPPAPVHLRVATGAGGELDVRWVRRSRLGWAWSDGVDAPVGESRELYRVRVEAGANVLEVETGEPRAQFGSAAVAGLGSASASISVVQIGDFAISRPAVLTLSIS